MIEVVRAYSSFYRTFVVVSSRPYPYVYLSIVNQGDNKTLSSLIGSLFQSLFVQFALLSLFFTFWPLCKVAPSEAKGSQEKNWKLFNANLISIERLRPLFWLILHLFVIHLGVHFKSQDTGGVLQDFWIASS